MHTPQPTKATPAGCVVGLLGVAFLVMSTALGFVVYKILAQESIDWSLLWKCGLGALGCFILGLLIIRFGLKLALNADMSDPYSTTKPKMRF